MTPLAQGNCLGIGLGWSIPSRCLWCVGCKNFRVPHFLVLFEAVPKASNHRQISHIPLRWLLARKVGAAVSA